MRVHVLYLVLDSGDLLGRNGMSSVFVFFVLHFRFADIFVSLGSSRWHASQFCDPRMYPEFWAKWHTLEIDIGSEGTFREMLRIKRSVQAQFSKEASHLAAQVLAASQGVARQTEADGEAALDPMAAAERQPGGGGKAGPTFVSAKGQVAPSQEDDKERAQSPQIVANADEIQISDKDI